jgi:hypothetical protein
VASVRIRTARAQVVPASASVIVTMSNNNPNHARSNIPTTENTPANLQTQTAANSPKASWTAEGSSPQWFADIVAV